MPLVHDFGAEHVVARPQRSRELLDGNLAGKPIEIGPGGLQDPRTVQVQDDVVVMEEVHDSARDVAAGPVEMPPQEDAPGLPFRIDAGVPELRLDVPLPEAALRAVPPGIVEVAFRPTLFVAEGIGPRIGIAVEAGKQHGSISVGHRKRGVQLSESRGRLRLSLAHVADRICKVAGVDGPSLRQIGGARSVPALRAAHDLDDELVTGALQCLHRRLRRIAKEPDRLKSGAVVRNPVADPLDAFRQHKRLNLVLSPERHVANVGHSLGDRHRLLLVQLHIRD